MSVRLLWPFVDLARVAERSQLIETLQAELELDDAHFSDPDARVSLQRALELLEESLHRTGARTLGLHAAARMTTEHIAPIEYVARSKNTLGEALRTFARFARLLCEGLHLELYARDGLAHVRISFDDNLTPPDEVYDLALSTLLRSLRRISGVAELAPVEVHMMSRPPRYARVYRKMFQCNLRFGMPSAQIVLDTQLLSLPLPSAEPALSRILERSASEAIASLPRGEDIASTVRDILTVDANLRGTSATRLARRLGLSVRTLARRLEIDGTSYRMLRDEARRTVALRDLAETVRPIHEIALQLGFASSQSFHRAFRRWTGDTAAEYRDRSRRHSSTG